VRFWGAVVAALDTSPDAPLDAAAPGRLTRPAELLRVPGTSTATDVVPALVDALAALPGPVTLVVDDLHLAASAEVDRGLTMLVTHLPATLCLVLVSRTTPALPLARLRGQGRVAELGVDDLRLSAAENAELLAAEAAVTGTTWTPADAARLHDRTEGWVIGAHLGVLSRRAHPAARTAPAPGARHLVDYLREEVLAPLPDDLRLVLRRTAVLDAFRADLAAAVTGHPDTPALLARAEREQLFVVPLDDRGDWYRFHHLFAEVLRDDLTHAEPGLVPQLHARAAHWLAEHGQPVEAVPHALAGDDRAAAALVARHAPVLIRIGQVETVLGWLHALGDDVCRADPRLALARALAGAHTGRPHEILSWTAAAERALDDPPPGCEPAPAADTTTRIEIAMMRWSAAVFAGDAAAGMRHVTDALRLLPAGVETPGGHILLALGSSQLRAGAVDESWATLQRAESAAEQRDEHLVVVSARGMRALQAALGGRPEEATRLAASAEVLAQRHGLVEHVNMSGVRAAQGWVALHDRRPRQALEHFRRALDLMRRGGLRVEVAELLNAQAAAEECLGWHARARRHRDEAAHVLARCPDPGHLWADLREAQDDPAAGLEGKKVVLSRRQVEILRLLADALTTAEIGERLDVSPRTVDAHLRALYRKLGVRSRTAAARYAVEHGLTGRGR
jgi:LuxR family maltose regulon positive regulatory protein